MWGDMEGGVAVKVGGKRGGHTSARPLKRVLLSGGEVCGMRGVAVKGIDSTQNPDGEGCMPAPD